MPVLGGLFVCFWLFCLISAVFLRPHRANPMINPGHTFDPSTSAILTGGAVRGNWPSQFKVTYPFVRLTVDESYLCLESRIGRRRMPDLWLSKRDLAMVQMGRMSVLITPGLGHPSQVRFSSFGPLRPVLQQFGWVQGGPPGAWFPDPWRRHQYRFGTPQGWTAEVADNGVEQTDPPR